MKTGPKNGRDVFYLGAVKKVAAACGKMTEDHVKP